MGMLAHPNFVKRLSQHRILRKHWENQSFSSLHEKISFTFDRDCLLREGFR
jgi:hypothetical protein